MDLWADSNGPPRKKMRKGTKSCVECVPQKMLGLGTSDKFSAKVFGQVAGARSVAHTTPIVLTPAMNADYEVLPALIRSMAPMTPGPRRALPKESSDIVFGNEWHTWRL